MLYTQTSPTAFAKLDPRHAVSITQGTYANDVVGKVSELPCEHATTPPKRCRNIFPEKNLRGDADYAKVPNRFR